MRLNSTFASISTIWLLRAVGDAEHERRDAAVRRDDAARAEHDRGGRPREAREQDSRAEREDEQADERLDRHHEVRRAGRSARCCRSRSSPAFHAEEERAAERAAGLAAGNSLERARAAGEIGEREQRVRDEVAHADDREELRPTDGGRKWYGASDVRSGTPRRRGLNEPSRLSSRFSFTPPTTEPNPRSLGSSMIGARWRRAVTERSTPPAAPLEPASTRPS